MGLTSKDRANWVQIRCVSVADTRLWRKVVLTQRATRDSARGLIGSGMRVDDVQGHGLDFRTSDSEDALDLTSHTNRR